MHGQAIPKGMPTPIPESHYTDLRHKPDTVREQIVEARYVCTQCHVAQANVEALVENSFGSQE
jgi:nitrate reductase cytochrome c-type subunit